MLRPLPVLLGVLGAALMAGAPAYAADTPDVDVSGDVTAVTTTTATVTGTVDPNGSPIADCHFNYGTFFDYGQTAPCSVNPGTGDDPVTVTGALTGLPAGTTIHFQLEATNDETFESGKLPAPTVTGVSAVGIAFDRATLTGVVNPNGLDTTCIFEYGEGTINNFREPCAPSPGSGTAPVQVSATITGLLPSLLWHYRIVATNTSGETDTPTQTFTTPAAPPSTKTPDPVQTPKGTAVSLPSKAKVKAGKVALKVACTGDFSCNGPLTLVAKVKSHGRAKSATIGRVAVSLSAGASSTYSIKLSSAARALLKHGRSLKVTAKLEGTTKTITLKS